MDADLLWIESLPKERPIPPENKNKEKNSSSLSMFTVIILLSDVLTRSNATFALPRSQEREESGREGSLLSSGSGLRLRGHGVLLTVVLGLALKLSR
ncbi:hypothetical protein NEIRO03_1773 [Nematocida sp. AWRm78]|nr:hypothetical protein NEIRO03_1773 [Nematocida sp. AWRm78]